MTAKQVALTSMFLVGASLGTSLALSTASSAQTYYGGPYRYGHRRYYNYAPGYGYGRNDDGPTSNCDRGGPGPRVGCGSGMGIGAER